MDIWYPSTHLNLDDKRNMLNDAKAIIDTGVGRMFIEITDDDYKRVPREVSFEEQMKDLDNKSHFIIYARDGFTIDEYPYLQIAFCTMAKTYSYDTFLSIELPIRYLEKFESKYNLQCKH